MEKKLKDHPTASRKVSSTELKELKKIKVSNKKYMKETELKLAELMIIKNLTPPSLNIPTVCTFYEELQDKVFVKLLAT